MWAILEILKSIEHPNIISLHEVFESKQEVVLILQMLVWLDIKLRIINVSYIRNIKINRTPKYNILTQSFWK